MVTKLRRQAATLYRVAVVQCHAIVLDIGRQSKSKEANKYSEKHEEQSKTKNTPTGGRKIRRAYSRVAVVPPRRVAVVHPPLEVMRQAVQQTNNKRNKRNKTIDNIKIRDKNKTERTDKT